MSTPRPDAALGGVVVPDPMAIADHAELTTEERRYIGAARAANTVRGYRSDWTEFATWCAQQGVDPLPAAPRTVSGYLTRFHEPPPRRHIVSGCAAISSRRTYGLYRRPALAP